MNKQKTKTEKLYDETDTNLFQERQVEKLVTACAQTGEDRLDNGVVAQLTPS